MKPFGKHYYRKASIFLKRTLILLFLLALPFTIYAQKKPLDVNVYKSWTFATSPGISKSGKYTWYDVHNTEANLDTLHVRSMERQWEKVLPGGRSAFVTNDERYLIYIGPDQSIVRLQLELDLSKVIGKARKYSAFVLKKEDWIVFIDTKGNLVMTNVQTLVKKEVANVMDYMLSPDKKKFLVYYKTGGSKAAALDIISFPTFERISIWSGSAASGFTFDETGRQMAFMVEKNIYYYKEGEIQSMLLHDDSLSPLDTGLEIVPGTKLTFSRSGSVLFFNARSQSPVPVRQSPDIWIYNDPLLFPEKLKKGTNKNVYLCSINLSNKKAHRLVMKDEVVMRLNGLMNDYLVIEYVSGNKSESYWNINARQTTFVVSAKTGERKLLKQDARLPIMVSHFSISPDDLFLVYYDREYADYFSFCLRKGTVKNLTKDVPVSWLMRNASNELDSSGYAIGLGGWLPNDEGILVYSKYDIWKLDPSNRKRPVNMTNGIGAKEKIVFCLASNKDDFFTEKEILLKAFDTKTKEGGFYWLKSEGTSSKQLVKASMGPYSFQDKFGEYRPLSFQELVGSSDGSAFLLKRQNTNDYPNFWFTRDFSLFKPVSQLAYHKGLKWLTTELHYFALRDGGTTSGILYKPEDFDPARKYPVIIYFYNQMTHNLNVFPIPFFGGVIDYAHFVTNDYLVFTPDILYKRNDVGESALQTVEAAAAYLGKKHWVDSTKIGVNGHSFGGYELNYILTHSKKFAAAISGAGASNLTSAFGAIDGVTGGSKQSNVERGFYRLEGTPSEYPQEYIRRSPLFFTRNVSMPVLIFHNPGDEAVSVSQSIELFTSLRREGKKVWMLQYPNENHINMNRNNAIDLEIRYMQFFDYYLKGAPMPAWMKSK